MSENYSYIEETVIVPDNGEPSHAEYKWIGDNDECSISESSFWRMVGALRAPAIGEIVRIGELELTCIGEESLFVYIFTRNKRFAMLKTMHFRLSRWLQLINYRILHTLIVWNLARYKPGVSPRWGDVKLFIKKVEKEP